MKKSAKNWLHKIHNSKKLFAVSILGCLLIIIIFQSIPHSLKTELIQGSEAKSIITKIENRSKNNDILQISSTEAIDYIRANLQKPIIIYIYASWCSICDMQTPIMVQFIKNYNFKPIFISIDSHKTHDNLRNYLKSFKGDFLFFNVNDANFKNALNEIGLKYKNAVPFTAIIDKNGKIISQFGGTKKYWYLQYLAGKISKEI